MAFILYTPCAQAQIVVDDDEHTFYGGLIGGVNFTQVDGDNFAGYHKVGWNAGAVIYTSLGESVFASLELLYAQRGSRAALSQLPKMANDQSTVLVDYKIKLNYAEVPILIHYFDKKSNHIGAGLSYAHLVRSKEIYKDANGALYEQDAKLFPFRKFDINLIINANVHLWKGFYFNPRFQYSLLSVRNAHNYITGRAQQFNNTWALRAMYIF
ncbi:MAG: porin family protein [Chitinophagaceae bacterium]